MHKRKFDELISHFNRKVSDMSIDQKYKMELLGMITAIGFAHEKELGTNLASLGTDCISREQVIATIDSFNVFESRSDQIKLELMIRELPPIQPVNNSENPNSSDSISRQAAISAIDECYCGGEDSCGEPWIYRENAVEAIQMIEPIQPKTAKRIIGKSRGGMTLWYQCNVCNEPVDEKDAYCRGCGRRLIDG